MDVEGTNRTATGGQRPLWLLGKKKEVFIRCEGNLGDHGDHGLKSQAGGISAWLLGQSLEEDLL